MEESDCSKCKNDYINILHEELIPAMGCTEPVAIALCAAKARSVLAQMPKEVLIEASGSIIKNVKSVIVPHTDNMKGINIAAAVGIIGGKPEKMLNVLADITKQQQEEIPVFLSKTDIKTGYLKNSRIFDICVTVKSEEHYAKVRIADYHTNIIYIEKDGEVLLDIPLKEDEFLRQTDRGFMSVEGIWDYITLCDITKLKPVLDPQIYFNMKIAEEGLKNSYGSNIGKTLLSIYKDNDVKILARAYAAAGSDARMNGCEMPVVINSDLEIREWQPLYL